jgi:hypothetical protein
VFVLDLYHCEENPWGGKWVPMGQNASRKPKTRRWEQRWDEILRERPDAGRVLLRQRDDALPPRSDRTSAQPLA